MVLESLRKKIRRLLKEDSFLRTEQYACGGGAFIMGVAGIAIFKTLGTGPLLFYAFISYLFIVWLYYDHSKIVPIGASSFLVILFGIVKRKYLIRSARTM